MAASFAFVVVVVDHTCFKNRHRVRTSCLDTLIGNWFGFTFFWFFSFLCRQLRTIECGGTGRNWFEGVSRFKSWFPLFQYSQGGGQLHDIGETRRGRDGEERGCQPAKFELTLASCQKNRGRRKHLFSTARPSRPRRSCKRIPMGRCRSCIPVQTHLALIALRTTKLLLLGTISETTSHQNDGCWSIIWTLARRQRVLN